MAIAEKERKLIWDALADWPPDLVLSLGTGTSWTSQELDSQHSSAPRLGIVPHLKYKIKIAKDHVRSSLDCEQAWNDFHDRVASIHRERYIRINPALSIEIPKLDEVRSLGELKDAAHSQMALDPRIKKVAHHLLASCFYFEMTGLPSDNMTGCSFPGKPVMFLFGAC